MAGLSGQMVGRNKNGNYGKPDGTPSMLLKIRGINRLISELD
jgi:hypothetical protein